MIAELHVERVWAMMRGNSRCVGAIVSGDLRRIECDRLADPWRSLVRTCPAVGDVRDAEAIEQWAPHTSIHAARRHLASARIALIAAGWQDARLEPVCD